MKIQNRIVLAFLFFLSACATPPTPSPTSTPAPTFTPAPSATSTLAPTATVTPVPTATLAPLGKGKIAFVAKTKGVFYDEIYVANLDGSNLRKISEGSGVHSLRWSPDGTKLLFTSVTGIESMRGLGESMYLVNADGSNLKRLTDFYAISPSWAPDGSILFSGWLGKGFDIYTMSAEGRILARLTFGDFKIDGNIPIAWSPDGNHILLDRSNVRTSDFWVMKPDGTDARQIVSNCNCYAAWSPDGQMLAYIAQAGLYGVRLSDSKPFRITDESFGVLGYYATVAWSPNGKRIVFSSEKTDGSSLYAINVDGSGLTRLINNLPERQLYPVWLKNSAHILYLSIGINQYEIKGMNASDGSGLTTLIPFTSDVTMVYELSIWEP